MLVENVVTEKSSNHLWNLSLDTRPVELQKSNRRTTSKQVKRNGVLVNHSHRGIDSEKILKSEREESTLFDGDGERK